ncbi:LacI family DNA-binding transcriptional regulator [Streptomyces sp. NEAU-H3]|uniref:LacI family DNA-binding transcriptional regulator n=1 Tax=Streptomyces sp. NEAU-H3 TaxID=2720636 RepID=UPI001439CD0F|nr:LacI family DNA-binding transcriptional regulator [Streptomyces sp. NEAU-H3]NJA56450.1 LacI family transcriptional regulator [Streptomyces sp. NEAU-H3]
MTVTLSDVASRAGVSPATVSRVLNGNYPVAEGTRERVLRAVDELDYVLNGPASSLAAATSDLVGVLVNDIADPFFGIIASAVQSQIGGPGGRAGGERLAVVCGTGGAPERELTYLTLLQRQRAAAVVLTGGAVEDPAHSAAVADKLRKLGAAGTRVILLGRPPLPEAGPAVTALTFDNRSGARELTAHLLALGHRRIGCVAGPPERTTTRHRLEGHRAALAEAGIEDLPGATVHGAYDRASGYRAVGELLDHVPDLTAIVAANDTVALGACAALRERGLRVPEDVSVTGFDDLPFSADALPALTTVRLPLQATGARAGRIATGRDAAPAGGEELVGGELVVRGSTGAAK